MRITLCFASSLALFVLAACSAVVGPDPGRLGGHDAGPLDDVALDPDGASVCPAPLVACGARCLDLSIDVSSCGACGRACGSGQSCVSGVCVCTPGTPGCGPTGGGLGDSTSCGPAAARCRSDQLCIDGACRCRPPLTPAGDVCVGGHCVGGCPDRTQECDGACVNFRNDPLHCGECGRACGSNEACEDGSCRDVEPATGCTTCPCDTCGGSACCILPRYDVPYCLDADRCP